MTRILAEALRSREIGIFLAFVIVLAVATSVNPSFLFSHDGWRDLLLTPSMLVLVAIGSAVVIITRNVDLSVGSVVGLSAYLCGSLFQGLPGIPIIAVFALCVLFGAGLGLVNGVLSAYGKVPSLVITLGTMYAFRGVAVLWAGSNRVNASDMPRSFLHLGTATILSIPYLAIIALVVLLAVGWYLRNRRAGREFYAMGSDPDAAELYGLKVRRGIMIAFVVSGALAGLAGVLFAARYGTSSSQTGTGLELQAIGAAVIGGVAIFGGSGTVYGAAIGAMLLMTINRALPILGIGDFWQQAVVGALIVGAITLDRLLALRTHRRLVKQRDAPPPGGSPPAGQSAAVAEGGTS